MGKIRPNKGSILIDDKEIETLNRVLYYSHLAVVSYNTYLFNESIRDNFRLAKPTVKDEEIIKALKDVNMDEFVSSIGGLDYVIREDSANISGGQRQRLCLAINMVANKDIYVFDEATSNIDIDSEEIIINNIKVIINKIITKYAGSLANDITPLSDVITFLILHPVNIFLLKICKTPIPVQMP